MFECACIIYRRGEVGIGFLTSLLHCDISATVKILFPGGWEKDGWVANHLMQLSCKSHHFQDRKLTTEEWEDRSSH